MQNTHKTEAAKGGAAHTATPWFVASQNDALFVVDRRPPGHAEVVTKVAGEGNASQDEANAEFIVRACNAFRPFAEALERIAKLATEGPAGLDAERMNGALEAIRKQAVLVMPLVRGGR